MKKLLGALPVLVLLLTLCPAWGVSCRCRRRRRC